MALAKGMQIPVDTDVFAGSLVSHYHLVESLPSADEVHRCHQCTCAVSQLSQGRCHLSLPQIGVTTNAVAAFELLCSGHLNIFNSIYLRRRWLKVDTL